VASVDEASARGTIEGAAWMMTPVGDSAQSGPTITVRGGCRGEASLVGGDIGDGEAPICGTRDSHVAETSALNFEIFCRGFAPVGDFIEFDNLTFVQTAEAGLLDCGDMDEDIFSAPSLRLNKSVPLLRIEPLHAAARHYLSPMLRYR
jgi:hypothetical protein